MFLPVNPLGNLGNPGFQWCQLHAVRQMDRALTQSLQRRNHCRKRRFRRWRRDGEDCAFHMVTKSGIFQRIMVASLQLLISALRESTGEYFCWLSHDDQYLPEKISKEVEFIQTLPSNGAVVFCRHALIDQNGDFLQELPPPPQFNPDTAAYQLLLFQWLHCCTILAPRSMYLEMGGFREDLPTTQDYDLLMKMGLRYPFFEVPEVLLLARSHPEQGCLTLTHLNEIERF